MEPQFTHRLICCCGAGGWAKVIGWIQTLQYTFAVLAFFYVVVVDSFSSMSPESPLSVMAGFLIITLLLMLLIVGAAMGIYLLRGSYKGIIEYITYWINYACFSLSLYIILPAGDYFFGYISATGMSFAFLPYLVGAIFQAFCIWVVSVHRSELEIAKSQRDEPYEI